MNHPCEDCRSENCTDMCCKWREWFRGKWAEIRRMYGKEDRDNETTGLQRGKRV